MRLAAISNPYFTDQALLAYFAKNDEDRQVREAALRKLTDQAVLFDIAKNDESGEVRRTAVEGLTSPALLAEIAEIAKSNKDWEVWRVAERKLQNLKKK